MKKVKVICISTALVLLVGLMSIMTAGYIRYRNIIKEKPIDEVIAEIRNQEQYVTLDKIDKDFLNAIIAVEDPEFYDHNGIRFSNILEAFITNMKEHRMVMGGSTITQQLSKNIYLDQRKQLTRKTAEIFFVKDLEQTLSKDEILELYVNVIYFGDGYYGIKEASEGYFNTGCDKLTLSQATILAGLPQAPAVYQLSDGLTLAKQRQRTVLEAMASNHYIEEKQISKIFNSPIH